MCWSLPLGGSEGLLECIVRGSGAALGMEVGVGLVDLMGFSWRTGCLTGPLGEDPLCSCSSAAEAGELDPGLRGAAERHLW